MIYRYHIKGHTFPPPHIHTLSSACNIYSLPGGLLWQQVASSDGGVPPHLGDERRARTRREKREEEEEEEDNKQQQQQRVRSARLSQLRQKHTKTTTQDFFCCSSCHEVRSPAALRGRVRSTVLLFRLRKRTRHVGDPAERWRASADGDPRAPLPRTTG